jgi:hypothetical protein
MRLVPNMRGEETNTDQSPQAVNNSTNNAAEVADANSALGNFY